MILSTVIGVYLATSEKLRSAVDFHYLTTLEKKYYTPNALREELTGNNKLIDQYLYKRFNKDDQGNIVSYSSIGAIPGLNSFVWKTLQNTSDTRDLPVDTLQDANRYYLGLSGLIRKLSYSHGQYLSAG
ncbi:MAG: hypothetical protein P8101_22560 [Candidatus Thiodiazotropha sp.]